MRSKSVFMFSIGVVLALTLIGCQVPQGSSGKPTVIVDSPLSGSEFSAGDEVQVKTTATDSQGVTRVELQVDGATVHTDSSPIAQGQSQFAVVQTWKATGAGNHTIVVRAYNRSGAFTDAGLSIVVNQLGADVLTDTPTAAAATTAAGTATPGSPPTETPMATAPPTAAATNTTLPGGCTLNSQFVADVTIPDGSVVQPGATFVKTWRVLNSGTCAWDNTFRLVSVSTENLGAGPTPLASTPPGAVADISLTMVAPLTPGSHSSAWQLRSPNGTLFGTQLTVVINVSSVSTSNATKTPLPGAPAISSFTCSPCTVVVGSPTTLSWGPVSNATSVTINGGIGNVTAPSNRSVTAQSAGTLTYTMTATGPGGTTTASVSISVVANYAGHWDDNFGYMDLTQNGASVTGTFHNSSNGGDGTLQGTVDGDTINGTVYLSGSGTFGFTLGLNSTFSGVLNGTMQWCGARTGFAFPDGCGFSGTWETQLGPSPDVSCSVSLTQVGSTVGGTYCNGTIPRDVITYFNGYVFFNASYVYRGTQAGGLQFYLPVFTYQQFQGNYRGPNASGPYEWCGWRVRSSAPVPCLK